MQTLATAFVLLFLLPLVHTEVVNRFEDVKECKAFFYKGTVLQLWIASNLKHICQRYNNSYHFATLYDIEHHIPVYSAYLLEKSTKGGRTEEWKIEPQLHDKTWKEKEMMEEEQLKKSHPNNQLGEEQALDEDYKNTNFDRGHLNPNGHHDDDSRDATFTLTNVVPQNRKLNQGHWREYEEELIKKNKNSNCAKFYVLVGANSSQNWIQKPDPTQKDNKLINRVNIPSWMWNAYCCVDQNDRPIASGAATADNTAEANVVRLSVEALTLKLNKVVGKTHRKLFHDNCRPEKKNKKGNSE